MLVGADGLLVWEDMTAVKEAGVVLLGWCVKVGLPWDREKDVSGRGWGERKRNLDGGD